MGAGEAEPAIGVLSGCTSWGRMSVGSNIWGQSKNSVGNPLLGQWAGRIGIMGGSYGGFMVAAALAFRPDVFAVGVDIRL